MKIFMRSACAIALLLPLTVTAKVAADEAERLKDGGDLTPLGAERAGNADGSIPAWGGGLMSSEGPDNYEGFNTRLYNPWPEDKPIAVISNSNLAEYKQFLSPGQIALFKKFDDFTMPLFASRRRNGAPEFVYDATLKNATNATLEANGEALANAIVGVPFPIPGSGREVIWNHKTRFRGMSGSRWNVQAAVTSSGAYNLVKLYEDFKFNYSLKDATPDSLNNVLIYFLQEIREPARLAGQFLLVHETMDQVKEPRRAWLYNPGQRRLRRAPNVGYDNPGTGSDGLRTNDQLDSFNGAMDRYTWKLIGKKEMIIPYNSYELHSDEYEYDDILGRGHINQDLTRYEKHRVWVVEAEVRDGTSHIYASRTFYVDEDTWTIVLQDIYDKRGELWRVHEQHVLASYGISEQFGEASGLPGTSAEVAYDLLNNRYLAFALNNQEDEAQEDTFGDDHFTPSNVKRMARR